MHDGVARGTPDGLRWIDADNAGPFTLEGTRSHIVGRRRAAVVDPGPAIDRHVDALARELERGGAEQVVVLVTHAHGDHTGAAAALAARIDAPVMGAWGAGAGEGGGSGAGPPPGLRFRALTEGERVRTDVGDLVAVSTPGHAREHVALHWPDAGAAFVGDLLLGTGDTTWVGEYPGCVADYLESLDRVDALAARLLLPAHGPPILDPAARIERYRTHRLHRIARVRLALADRPDAALDDLLAGVYGGAVPAALVPAARASLAALVEHVHASPD